MEISNSTKRFLQMIINSSEKKAKEENMSEEEKAKYLNTKLFEFFEQNEIELEKLMPVFEEVYS